MTARNLLYLREVLGYRTNSYTWCEIASATTTQITVEALVDSGGSDQQFVGAWCYMASGTDAIAGQTRKVKAFDPETGTLTLSRALAEAPTSTDYIELHTLLSPDDWDRCINRALAQCYYNERETITPVPAQTEYALASYSWITNPAQVRDVYWRYGSTASQYRYHPATWWEVVADATVMTLVVRPNSATGTYLVLEGLRPYPAISGVTATECPEEWVVAGAEMEAYRLLSRNDPAQDASRYKAHYLEASARFHALSRKYQPMPRIRVQHPDSPLRNQSSDIVT